MKRIYKYPKTVISVIILITLFFGYNLRNVDIDNDTKKFLPEEHPTRIAIDEAKEIFGPSQNISVGIQARRGSIFTSEAIRIIKHLTEKFELLGSVDEVKSLTNSDFIDGVDGSIAVSDLVEDFSGSEEDVKKLKNKILSWDIYQDILVSNDFTASQLVVTLKRDITVDEKVELYYTINSIIDDNKTEGFNYHIAGVPAVSVLLSSNMGEDLSLLIPIVILILLVSLYLSFKRLSGILLPMITVFISTIWTMGLMGFLGVPLSMLGIIIPVLLMAVGSAYGIHVISHYYDDVKDYEGELNREKHFEVILKSISYVKKPIILAALTTVAGFASLAASSVIPMRDFGIFTAVGIVFALIIAITLIPVLLVFNHKSAGKRKSRSLTTGEGIMERGLGFYYDNLGKRKVLIILSSILILLLSALGAKKLVVDNSVIEYFKEDAHIRASDGFLREKFTGTHSFDILINGEGAGVDPLLLKEMDNLGSYLTEKYKEVPKVISFTDTVKRMNQVMHTESNTDEEDSYFQEDDNEYSDIEVSSFFFDDEFDEEGNQEPVVAVVESEESYSSLSSSNLAEIMSNAYAASDSPEISADRLIDLVKRETNYKGFSYFEIPSKPEKYGHSSLEGLSNLLSQYYAMTGRLDGFIGDNDDFLSPENLKMTVMINADGNAFVREIIPVIEEYISDYFPKGYDIKFAGIALTQDATTQLVTSSAVKSILLSLVIVFVILAIAYRSLIAGLFGIIPLGFTVLFNYGIMGLFGIKLDMSTAMVGSIAIGIGIDYTIHFMSSYHKHSRNESCEVAITKKSLKSSGKAVIFNAVSVAAGFAVLIKSNFNPLMYLGILITITMVVASVASLSIMPALLNISKPKFMKREDV